MAVSIKDIARLAGVSHSTVSRALRNSPLIPEPTASRIKQIAADLSYSASAVGRSLVTRKTETIGVVVTSIDDPFNGEVVAGIEEVANGYGYSVILATSQADPEREIRVVRSFGERRVDGILVASSRLGANYLTLLSELHVPVVLLNNQHPSDFVYSVSIDNVDGGYQAAQHLIELGHSKIAYIGDQSGLQSDAERRSGFKKALRKAGLAVPAEYLTRGDGRTGGGRSCAQQLLTLPDRPTAIFCYNDMTALGAMEAAAEQNLVVGGDLSIVGFDDLFFASFLQPPLTTIRQPKKELGRRATELLMKLLKGGQAERTVVMKGELIARGSSTTQGDYQSIFSGKNSATSSW
jgi:DNA-binding LacI/PurR family transcriptional regulator